LMAGRDAGDPRMPSDVPALALNGRTPRPEGNPEG
jgi:hypothetical protein